MKQPEKPEKWEKRKETASENTEIVPARNMEVGLQITNRKNKMNT